MEEGVAQRSSYYYGNPEEANYGYGEEGYYEDYGEYAEYRKRTKILNARNVTHLLVIISAIAIFSSVFANGLRKLYTGRVLQRKRIESETGAWFKFALCLRPEMTDSLLKDLYISHTNETFHSFLTNKTEARWNTSFYLDYGSDLGRYQEYLRDIHPWEKLSLEEVSAFRVATLKRSFKEFRVDRKPMAYTEVPEKGLSHHLEGNMYTTLPPKKQPNVSVIDNALIGEYRLSPFYLGCLNVTVNKPMARRQMEIVIKFRNVKTAHAAHTSDDVKSHDRTVKMYDVVDFFAYNANDTFTEFSTMGKIARFSVSAESFAYLWVKGAKKNKVNTASKPCNNNPGYSSGKCFYWCSMRTFLRQLNCTLPWMDDMLEKPWIADRFNHLKKCSSYENRAMAMDQLGKTFDSAKFHTHTNVKTCKTNCIPSCTSYKVQMMSLGSKSIGKNFGISLTVSPDVEVITEYFDYSYLSMLAELCASVSFLFGLSAIAIYDWVVALVEWCALKTGLLRPTAEQEPAEEWGDGDPIVPSDTNTVRS